MLILTLFRDQAVYGITDPNRKKKGIFYRLFKPNQADYNILYEDSRKSDHHQNTYRPDKGEFPSAKPMHEHHW